MAFDGPRATRTRLDQTRAKRLESARMVIEDRVKAIMATTGFGTVSLPNLFAPPDMNSMAWQMQAANSLTGVLRVHDEYKDVRDEAADLVAGELAKAGWRISRHTGMLSWAFPDE